MGASVVCSNGVVAVGVALAVAGASTEVELPQALNNTADIPRADTVAVRMNGDFFIVDYLLQIMTSGRRSKGYDG